MSDYWKIILMEELNKLILFNLRESFVFCKFKSLKLLFTLKESVPTKI